MTDEPTSQEPKPVEPKPLQEADLAEGGQKMSRRRWGQISLNALLAIVTGTAVYLGWRQNRIRQKEVDNRVASVHRNFLTITKNPDDARPSRIDVYKDHVTVNYGVYSTSVDLRKALVPVAKEGKHPGVTIISYYTPNSVVIHDPDALAKYISPQHVYPPLRLELLKKDSVMSDVRKIAFDLENQRVTLEFPEGKDFTSIRQLLDKEVESSVFRVPRSQRDFGSLSDELTQMILAQRSQQARNVIGNSMDLTIQETPQSKPGGNEVRVVATNIKEERSVLECARASVILRSGKQEFDCTRYFDEALNKAQAAENADYKAWIEKKYADAEKKAKPEASGEWQQREENKSPKANERAP